MRRIISAFLLALSAFLCGCASVPQTKIQFDPEANTFLIESPKDIELVDLKLTAFPATATNAARFELTIGAYNSRNNIAVIRAITEANNQNLKRAVEIGGTLIGAAIDEAK